jgi:DNA-binding CsgD family transcriptional regulator
MSVDQLTDDTRIRHIYLKFQKETGGTLEDFASHPDRCALTNWGVTSEARFQEALHRLLQSPGMTDPVLAIPTSNESIKGILEKIGMENISPIVRLNSCYSKSGSPNLYEFAYRRNRMSINNWGAKSEHQFVEALNSYLREQSAKSTQVEEPRTASGLEQDISVFLEWDDDALKYFYIKHFSEIHEAIRSKSCEGMVISQIAAEMRLNWPYRYRARLLRDYIFPDKGRIFKTQGLGKKRRRTVILSFIWAAKGSQRDMERFSQMSPDELMAASPLSPNEKKALSLRFLGAEPTTLAEAARVMNVTRERVRQHEKTAETKLRTLGINQFAREWLRRNSSRIWSLLSNDDGSTVEPKNLKGGIRKSVPGEVLLATVLAGWTLEDVLSLEGDPIDDWWIKKPKA